MTEFLQLRHKLIPYLYSMNYLTYEKGLPLLQPMYYHDDVPEAYEVPNEYWFGTELIACPITKPAHKETLLAPYTAWLPEGDWFDFFTGQHYRGGRKLTVYRNLDTIPVFLKAGGIVPLAEDFTDSHLHNPQVLEVVIANGADGDFDLYEDRPEGTAEEAPVITHFAFRAGKNPTVTIRREGEWQGVVPADRTYRLRLLGVEKPVSLSLSDGTEFTQSYEEARKELTITICPKGDQVCLTLEEGTCAIADGDKLGTVYNILHKAQLPYEMKTLVYETMCREENPARLLGKLSEMNLPNALLGALTEQIISNC